MYPGADNNAMGKLIKGPTTLVIAHRYSMVKDADHVVVLDRGCVVEQGTPAELIAAGGWFARLATQSTPDVAARPAKLCPAAFRFRAMASR